MSDVSNQILSDITVWMKYSRYLPNKRRRETWEELVTSNKEMHQRKYPEISDEIEEAYKFVYEKKVLPSMRSMQFAGKPIEVNPARIYNCSFLPADSPDAFAEIMFLLLGGTGVGFSVQKAHVRRLPPVMGPLRPEGRKRAKRYLVGDSIEGWADAVKVLVESYFYSKPEIDFDFSDIRSKGTQLVTSGGKAPGPEPLRLCLTHIKSILENAIQERGPGTKLKPIEVHDIICLIADAVLAGGIRRAALISLFSKDDKEMLFCKSGAWWEKAPWRGRANNSAVFVRSRAKKEDFDDFWEVVKNSGSGEPGIYFTNDASWGTNPCVEIGLRPFQMCNLTEINAGCIETQEDLNNAARAASFIGTLQAGYTDFHYLRDEWQETCEKDALIGVSMTGICSGNVLSLDTTEAANVVTQENARVAKLIGINPAARCCCVKPAGTTSLTLGTSSGIHAWHNYFYLRRIRVNKNEAIYKYLLRHHPELVEDESFDPLNTAVITIPQKAPEGAILRHEAALETLARVKHFATSWVKPGHRTGVNGHNVSCTISVKDDEWDSVGSWMWKNREHYNGIAVLPYDGGTYVQAPFEDCDKKTFEKLSKSLTAIDLTKIRETQDNTNLAGEIACGPQGCEIK